MDSPFMTFFSQGLADEGICVARFEFPYMVRRRLEGRAFPPDRTAVLLETWRRVIDDVGSTHLVIGGKSLGGRMASLIADDEKPLGLVVLGYPFHPLGHPEKLRIEHLGELETPTLICQGERDAMGNRETVEGLKLSPRIRFHWLAVGDHSFKPPVRSGRTERQNWSEAVATVAQFVKGLGRGKGWSG